MEKTRKMQVQVVQRLIYVVENAGMPVEELERLASLRAGALSRALEGDLSRLLFKDVEALATSLGVHPSELLAPREVG